MRAVATALVVSTAFAISLFAASAVADVRISRGFASGPDGKLYIVFDGAEGRALRLDPSDE